MLWRRFEIQGQPLLACVLVTVSASKLIAPIAGRMPEILEDGDGAMWLGENDAHPLEAVLKTMKGVKWQAAPEPKAPKKLR